MKAAEPCRHPSPKKTKANAVANAEDDRIRYRPRKPPQGPVLSIQKVVSQIETTQHVQTAPGNADGCDSAMVQL
jgi:hypothetical protein